MKGTPYTKGSGDIFGSRFPVVDTHDGIAVHRLPPGSDQLLDSGVLHNTRFGARDSLTHTASQEQERTDTASQEQERTDIGSLEQERSAVRLFNSGLPDRPQSGVSKQGFVHLRPHSSNAPVLRECWPTENDVETSGCSVQIYKGAWYNICRSVKMMNYV